MRQATGSAYRRGSGWEYRVQWREGDKRRSKSGSGFRTKAEAQTALRRVLRDLDDGRAVTPQGTVADFLRDWIDTYSRTGAIKRSTETAYRDHIDKHLIPHLGHLQLGKLSPAHVARCYADLLAHGERRHASGRGLSPKTVRNIHQTLNKALGTGVRHGLVARNVAQLVDLPKDRTTEMQTWTKEQVAQFLATAAERGDYLLPIWVLLTAAPLRRGEICGLRWGDVDLVDKVLHVRQTRLEVQGHVYDDTPKSNKSRRTIPLTDDAWLALATWKNTQDDAARALGGWTTDRVLTDLDGHEINPESLTRRFYAATKRAGLPQIRLHSLRSTFGTNWLHLGKPVHQLSALLGHADPGFTLRVYAPVMPSQTRENVSHYGDALRDLLDFDLATACANLCAKPARAKAHANKRPTNDDTQTQN